MSEYEKAMEVMNELFSKIVPLPLQRQRKTGF